MEAIRKFLKEHRSIYLAVIFLPAYLISFFLVERLVPTTGYWVSYMPLDDKIPFCEYFVVFYCCWYLMLIATGLLLLFKDDRNFRLYMYHLMIGFGLCLLICALFPNGQDLRPAEFERQNFFTDIIGLIYAADTNTNVLPSMHVVGAMACCYAVFHSKALSSPWLRAGMIVLTVLVNLSTVFIKQHSFLDVIAGLILSGILYFIIYGVIAKHMKPEPVPEAAALPPDDT